MEEKQCFCLTLKKYKFRVANERSLWLLASSTSVSVSSSKVKVTCEPHQFLHQTDLCSRHHWRGNNGWLIHSILFCAINFLLLMPFYKAIKVFKTLSTGTGSACAWFVMKWWIRSIRVSLWNVTRQKRTFFPKAFFKKSYPAFILGVKLRIVLMFQNNKVCVRYCTRAHACRQFNSNKNNVQSVSFHRLL